MDLKESDSNKRKKPSGFYYRAKKMKNKKSDALLSVSMKTFLDKSKEQHSENIELDRSSANESNEILIDLNSNCEISNSLDMNSASNPNLESSGEIPESRNSNDIESQIEDVSFISNANINVFDPSTWPEIISSIIRDYIIDSAGEIPDIDRSYIFPLTNGRSFSPKLFYCNFDNKKRSWLVYSTFNDSCYCFCCALYSRNCNSLSRHGIGFRDWKHIHQTLNEHIYT